VCVCQSYMQYMKTKLCVCTPRRSRQPLLCYDYNNCHGCA